MPARAHGPADPASVGRLPAALAHLSQFRQRSIAELRVVGFDVLGLEVVEQCLSQVLDLGVLLVHEPEGYVKVRVGLQLLLLLLFGQQRRRPGGAERLQRQLNAGGLGREVLGWLKELPPAVAGERGGGDECQCEDCLVHIYIPNYILIDLF